MASRTIIVLTFILGISVPVQSQPSVDFGFSQLSFSGVEGEDYTVQVKFFSGGITTGFLFSLSLDLSGTASSSDVSLRTTQGRFLPSDVDEPKDVEFALLVDNIAQESNETFAIVLSTNHFGGGATIRDRLEGVIIDSDVITFQLSEGDYTQNEQPNAVMEVLITKGSGIQLANPVYFRITPLTVEDALARGVISEFEPENGYSPNRANYEDFNNSVLYVEFPTDRNAVEVAIPIVDDDIDEADEQVFIIFLEVVNATNLDNLNILENREIGVGRIIDDEIIRIGFERQSYEVTEPNPDDEEFIRNLVYLIRGNNQITEQTYSVDLTVGDPGGNIKSATIETSNTSESFDYSFGLPDQTKQNVLFPPPMGRIPFVFSLNPDLAVEGTETFRATSAQVTPSGPYPVFQSPTGVTAFANTLIQILDNDEIKVGFEELNYTVNESSGTVEVCIIVISPPPTADLDVTVTLSARTIEETAGAGSDFTRLIAFLSIFLVFPSSPGSPTAGPRRECFDVTITDDDSIEDTESFSLLLQEDTFASQTGAIISPNLTEIFILDDDEVMIGFEQTTYSVNEGNVVEVCTVLTGTLNRSLEVFVKSSGGSATVDEDYNPVRETLTFGPTSNHTCFNFTTLEDKILEEDMEDLNLHLTTMALNVTLDPFLAHVHILDDDGATGPTIPTVDNTTSNKQFNIFAIAGAVVLLVVAMMIIVIVMIVALRCHHSTLNLQKNNKSEPLPAIKLSSITGEVEEEDLDSHAYDDAYKYNVANSRPPATHPPTLPPMPASRKGGYKLTTCPAYAPIDLKNIPTSRNGEYELTTCPAYAPTDIKNIPISASRNGEYELTTCPAYAPTNNIQSMPDKETKDGHYEIVVNTKPTIPPRMPASRNGGYEMTNCLAYAPSDIQSTTKEKTEDKL